ncbi:hypothetical protein [Streptomyces sp. WAC07061]|uniref:F0F1 ATP synthase subunit B family protein n=1 Tax=Streptomyces sp. WAC07061 TaxID=2487410 RepID=UPI00163B9C91|nr:hypothetical protein [Streptomyces sp. WAC07061]
MGPLKPNLLDLLVALFCFVAVFAVMAKVLLPRIGKALVGREYAIAGVSGLAEETQLEAQRVLAVCQAELAAARHEASRIRQAAHEEGAALLAEVRAEGLRAREEMVAASAVRLRADRAVAEAELREDVLGLATELAGRVVGEPLTDAFFAVHGGFRFGWRGSHYPGRPVEELWLAVGRDPDGGWYFDAYFLGRTPLPGGAPVAAAFARWLLAAAPEGRYEEEFLLLDGVPRSGSLLTVEVLLGREEAGGPEYLQVLLSGEAGGHAFEVCAPLECRRVVRAELEAAAQRLLGAAERSADRA